MQPSSRVRRPALGPACVRHSATCLAGSEAHSAGCFPSKEFWQLAFAKERRPLCCRPSSCFPEGRLRQGAPAPMRPTGCPVGRAWPDPESAGGQAGGTSPPGLISGLGDQALTTFVSYGLLPHSQNNYVDPRSSTGGRAMPQLSEMSGRVNQEESEAGQSTRVPRVALSVAASRPPSFTVRVFQSPIKRQHVIPSRDSQPPWVCFCCL